MGKILYYSNYCDNCKNLLSVISRTDLVKTIHFVCIDRRNQKNGKTYVVLESNQEVVLPDTIKSVPALLLLNDNYKVLFGDDIVRHLNPIEKVQREEATNYQGEPECFSIGSGSSFSGVVSDCYSFLDQDAEQLSAKGNGGMRQLYNYATLDHLDQIETPPDDYTPDKIGEVNIKNIENERNSVLKR